MGSGSFGGGSGSFGGGSGGGSQGGAAASGTYSAHDRILKLTKLTDSVNASPQIAKVRATIYNFLKIAPGRLFFGSFSERRSSL